MYWEMSSGFKDCMWLHSFCTQKIVAKVLLANNAFENTCTLDAFICALTCIYLSSHHTPAYCGWLSQYWSVLLFLPTHWLGFPLDFVLYSQQTCLLLSSMPLAGFIPLALAAFCLVWNASEDSSYKLFSLLARHAYLWKMRYIKIYMYICACAHEKVCG